MVKVLNTEYTNIFEQDKQLITHDNTNTNKYRNNFNELSLLGKGGYGSVYKIFR